MANAQMTQKQMYAFIAEQLWDNEEVVTFCNNKIAQLDRRKTAPRKVNAEVQERRDTIAGFLAGQSDRAFAVKEIADTLGYSSPQVTGAIRGLINADVVKAIEPEKKSQPKTYQYNPVVFD